MMNNNDGIKKSQPVNDPWHELRSFTQARIALGRAGISVPLKASLQFKLAHAHARDAVHASMNIIQLTSLFDRAKIDHHILKSNASSRTEYLQRPDKGRSLHSESANYLLTLNPAASDVAVIVADGLSSFAVDEHAHKVIEPLFEMLLLSGISISPVCIVQQGRVGIADEIGALLNAQLSLILIGERPGLSAADSLGAYITYKPAVGLTDESRNCISNIRPEGLSYQLAAAKIFYLIKESLRLKLSGVTLKDNGGLIG
jgi:ethanolamine ammonia-lyase small subunit